MVFKIEIYTERNIDANSVYVQGCMNIYMCICVHLCVYICTFIHTYLCACIWIPCYYTHMHTSQLFSLEGFGSSLTPVARSTLSILVSVRNRSSLQDSLISMLGQ